MKVSFSSSWGVSSTVVVLLLVVLKNGVQIPRCMSLVLRAPPVSFVQSVVVTNIDLDFVRLIHISLSVILQVQRKGLGVGE